MDEIKLSRFISLILRHKPETIGEKLSNDGYMEVVALIEGINKHFNSNVITSEILDNIVTKDDKGRYSFNADKTLIRANQGHSVSVNLGLKETTPPDVLFHGTGEKYIESILRDGLNKKSRQFVHLSKDLETAITVGKRHGSVKVLLINSKLMHKDGQKFFCSENGVWLTEHVDTNYIKLLETD